MLLTLFNTVITTLVAPSATAYAVLLKVKTGGEGGAKPTVTVTGAEVTVVLAPPETTVANARMLYVPSGAFVQTME